MALAQISGKYEDPDGVYGQDVQRVLQSIIDFSEKSLILFHACQIKALGKNKVALSARRYRRLMALLDQMVSPVPSPQLKCSFHPKVWLLRFDKTEGKGNEMFRLLVTSRNLSKQMDWEIGCVLDGHRIKAANDVSWDLRKFLREPRVNQIFDLRQWDSRRGDPEGEDRRVGRVDLVVDWRGRQVGGQQV